MSVAALRPVVAASWQRSAHSGVDPERADPPVDLTEIQLSDVRASHPIGPALDVVRETLVDAGADWVVAVGDAAGRLLWVEGDAATRRRTDRAGFVTGSRWTEDCVGTNAPGTALATAQMVQVVGAEHYARAVRSLTCVAAPVRDADGRVVGVLDITGGASVASPLARSLVRAATIAVEATLALAAATRPGRPSQPGERPHDPHRRGPRLEVLGTGAVLHTQRGRLRLGPRHAEILLLLAEHPAGLSAEELAVLLSDEELSPVTVRAEVSRLRRIVGPLLAQSRPYRLGQRVSTDVDVVRHAIGDGDVAAALASHPGPVLARSMAPGIVELRQSLHADLRAAALSSSDPAVIARWTASSAGADDYEAWQRLAAVSPAGSARHVRARARVAQLDRQLAS